MSPQAQMAALRRSEQRFRAMFEQFPFSIQIFAPGGRTIDANQAWSRLFGLTLDDVRNFNPTDDPQLAAVADLINRGFAGEIVEVPAVPFDTRKVRNSIARARGATSPVPDAASAPDADDGAPIWVAASMCPVRDETGEIREIIIVHRDVTGERRAAEEVRQTAAAYRAIFELAGDAIFVHDPVTGAILDANRRACELHGATLDEFRQRGIALLSSSPPYTPEEALRLIRLAAAGEPQLVEWLGRDQDGEPTWLEVNLRLATLPDGDRVLAIVRNISDRKQAEAALQRAYADMERRVEERTSELARSNEALQARTFELQTIFSALPDLYFRVDGENVIRESLYGALGSRGLGLPDSGLVGLRAGDFLPAAIAAELETAFAGARRAHALRYVEFELASEPAPRAFEARILPHIEDQLVVVVRDVTARREAERAVQRSEEHHRALIENSSDIATILSPDGTILYVSPPIERVLGYRPDELLGISPFTLVHPDDVDEVVSSFEALILDPTTPRSVIFRQRHKDGSYRIFESIGRSMDPPNTAAGFIVNSRDVTESREAERELRLQTALLKAQGEASIDGILVVDPDGRIVSFNRRFIELWDIPEDIVDSRSDERAIQWVLDALIDPAGFLERVQYLYTHPFEQSLDEIALKDGRVFDRYSGPVLSEDAQYHGRIWWFRDMTDRKRAEVALDQARRDAEHARESAERANRAKSDFLSRMSHELRTPLNGILGFAQLMSRKPLPEDQQKAVDHILKAGRHLLNLINEVLDIARIESNRETLSIEPVRVAGVVQEALSLIRPLADGTGPSLDRDVVIEAGLYVRADRQRLMQVLLNLLSNGLKYNQPGGSVTVSVASPRDGGDRVRILVRDTGSGIAPEMRDRMFTPFDRLGAEQSRVEGTGLGLALSRRLIEAMGGTLDFESEPGVGSTFWVELARDDSPLDRMTPDRRGARRAPATQPAPRAASLLYIEDNLANLNLIESIIATRPGLTLISALQGGIGIELARRHVPDLILLDLHLPDIAGDEVLQRLKADPRTSAIPVVIITADAMAGRVDRLMRAGAHTYLTKPLDLDEFLAVVDRIIGPAEVSDGARV